MRHLRSFDRAQPDGLLLALAMIPGVEAAQPIRMRSVPKPGGHGWHAVTWTQDGRQRTAEGSTHAAALRAAVRAARAQSAKAGVVA